MTSHVPIHARNHRRGGVDPLILPFPRARVWSTYATPIITVSDSNQEIYTFDRGVTTDEDTFQVKFWTGAGGGIPTARIRILRGGVYGVTYRFVADDSSGAGWADTMLGVELVDFSPDYTDHPWAVLAYGGIGAVHSYIGTILNDDDFLPATIHAVLRVPAADPSLPSLTFGRADYHDEDPTLNTGSYIEMYRLGDTDTQDWTDWWYRTPVDEAVPDPE